MFPRFLAALLLIAFAGPSFAQDASDDLGPVFTNSIGMTLIRLDAGTFSMGSTDGDLDEQPVHSVTISRPFYMGVYEVTNAQYEQFDPSHRSLRGKLGYSTGDDEAVVFVSWEEAVAFTEWLSEKEGRPYRLPTEAEWEYAARAGTTAPYFTGNTLSAIYLKTARESWFPDKDRTHPDDVVPLTVGQTPPNPWGLYDLFGNVEEWTHDWYGPYPPDGRVDPTGRADGDFRVTRGGSHSTLAYYLRSSNRMGTLPEDRSWLIGFRVVLGERPETPPLPVAQPVARYQYAVRQDVPPDVAQGPPADEPYFKGPVPYVNLLATDKGPFFHHNHQPGITETPNGDLLAIWYTTKEESGRYLAQAASRLRYGVDTWDPASIFWDVPDRNDHGNAIWWDGEQTLYHASGLSAAATWGNLALVLRHSTDNGVTWSKARLINPEHGLRNQVIGSWIETEDGTWMFTADAVSIGHGGTALHVSHDEGETWTDPGGTIAGIHASVVELSDGRLMAFGRGDDIDGHMPKSLSGDGGRTWTYEATEFPPLTSTQRLVLIRLKGRDDTAPGPLFFASFADNMTFTDADGQSYTGTGLFGALSYDDGETWPVRRLITPPGPPRRMVTARNRRFVMSPFTAEPRAYLAVTQARNGVIHLISSLHHYAFNEAWLETPPPVSDLAFPSKDSLAVAYDTATLPSAAGFRFHGSGDMETDATTLSSENRLTLHPSDDADAYWTDDRPDGFGAARSSDGLTVEFRARVTRSAAPNQGLDVIIHLGKDGRFGHHLSITPDGLYSFDAFSLDPVVVDLNNADAVHTFRAVVGPDGLLRLYRDGSLLCRLSPAHFVDLSRSRDLDTPSKTPYLRWGASGGTRAVIDHIAYDPGGAFIPEQP